MGNRDKDKEQSNSGATGTTGTTGEGTESACDARQAAQDLSHERATAIDKLVGEAITRESA